MTALGAVIEDLVKANNAVDIYEEYFAGKVCKGWHFTSVSFYILG